MFFYVSSPNRVVLVGVSIYDATQFVVPNMHTICMRLVALIGHFGCEENYHMYNITTSLVPLIFMIKKIQSVPSLG